MQKTFSTIHTRSIKKLIHRLRPKALVIYLLHGVTREPVQAVRNYTGKHVPEKYFDCFLDMLRKAGQPLSMDEVIEIKRKGHAYPDNAYAITFDDGFADNYEIAAPLLRTHNTPATFYVTTGWIDVNGMSWIDRLEYCLDRAKPGMIRLPWYHRPQPFDTASDRIRILRDIRANAKLVKSLDLNTFVDDIFQQCDESLVTSGSGPLDRKMSWSEVAELNGDRLFCVGGHTHTHTIMAYLEPAKLQAEVNTSLHLLHDHANVGPEHYSYPEGQEYCYNRDVVDMLESCGVLGCPTAIDGVNTGSESLFDLKRVMVG